MLEILTDPQAWAALLALTALEIVLGIDNIIFIGVLVSRLPPAERARARQLGLGFALVTRLLLLVLLFWLAGLVKPLFTLLGHAFSLRDLVLLGGGLFLIVKATLELHTTVELHSSPRVSAPVSAGFWGVVAQIGVIDLVFSLDSVVTAVGMARRLPVMATAIIIAMLVMLIAAGAVNRFIDRHPTLKVLALSFLLLIGFALIGEGWGLHVPKGYIYFAMAFAVFVEMINLRVRGPRPETGQ